MELYRRLKVLANPLEIIKRILSIYHTYIRQKNYRNNYVYGPMKYSILLASYPKSGNTFFRFFWMNLIQDIENLNHSVDFDCIDRFLPNEQYVNDLKIKWDYSSLPCLLKTHMNHKNRFNNLKTVHLFRNPFDTMISNYYYFSNRYAGPVSPTLTWYEKILYDNLERFRGSLSTFIDEYTDNYFNHFYSWMNTTSVPISYEELNSGDSPYILMELFSKLNIDSESITMNNIERAISLSSINNVKQYSPSDKMARLEEISFVRKGNSGQWDTEFNKRDMQAILDKFRLEFLLENCPSEYKKYISLWLSQAKEFIRN